MNTKIRQALVAVAFSAIAAAAVTGATTLRGETKETSLVETCAGADWPMIPAACLEGGRGYDVRYVSADRIDDESSMSFRFSTAFN
jgi:hypothetical protein